MDFDHARRVLHINYLRAILKVRLYFTLLLAFSVIFPRRLLKYCIHRLNMRDCLLLGSFEVQLSGRQYPVLEVAFVVELFQHVDLLNGGLLWVDV